MHEIVAIEIIVVTHCVGIILLKDMMVIGKTVLNAEILLKPRCMFIMGQTNIILKGLKILLNMNLLDVQNVIP